MTWASAPESRTADAPALPATPSQGRFEMPGQLRYAVGPGRLVIVTGAASGIGAAVVDRLLRAGTTVVGVDRDEQTVREGLSPIRADVTDVEAAQRTLAAAAQQHGGIDGVVTSAGVSSVRPVEDFNLAAIMHELTVNFIGTALWLSAAVPHLRASGGGRMVAIASQLAERPISGLGYYSATKAAVVSLVRTAATELAADEIGVNCICPGPTDTPLTARLPRREADATTRRVPLGRMAQPQEIAEPVVFLLGRGASYMTGSAVVVDGGFCAAYSTAE
jgi:NAD(P)-dependent dehydrogenase (short-subunit alcohol dehydrogenase family)